MSKTIKVRIPALITSDGLWCAYGYKEAQLDPDWSMMEEVIDPYGDGISARRVWITAELPIPGEDEVQALSVGDQGEGEECTDK